MVSDRGEEYFARFAERHAELLEAQDAGRGASYVLVDEEGAVQGRFNLYDIEDAIADVGYRVAQAVAGRGLATAAVRELCRLAAARGVRTLTARTSLANVASQRVLTKAGFLPTGPTDLAGKPAIWYTKGLTGSLTGEP